MSNGKKMVREHIVIDSKKLEKLRKKLTKTIDEFKMSVMESLEKSQDGPLGEALRPIEPSIQEIPQATITSPVITQQTGIISAEDLQQWVAQDKQLISSTNEAKTPAEDIGYAPYADVTSKPPVALRANGTQVFFAGVDNLVNSDLRNFLQRLGIRTFLPALEGCGNKSILEQFQLYNDFEFAIVVLSPDEYMFQKVQDPKNALLVSSQKTIFELGFLVGKLGRNRVVVFYEDINTFKRPTEYFDISYIAFDAAGLWQQRLIQQMRVGGIVFNEEKVVPV